MTLDIEAMARAAFEALHSLGNRIRNWDTHPDEDAGVEMGRNTFRAMAGAAAATVAPEPAPSQFAQEPLSPVGDAGMVVPTEPPSSAEPVTTAGTLSPETRHDG